MAEKEEFKDRLAEYNMDDDDENVNWNDKGNITDWFSFDFTLEELKTLRKKQSSEERDPRYDWKETVVTLDELVEITKYVVGEQELLGLVMILQGVRREAGEDHWDLS